jgi:N-acetylneuraminic acid mutarotase
MAGVINDTLFVVGGFVEDGASGVTGSLVAYDPITDVWSSRSPMPTPRASGMSAVVNGKLYILGGYTVDGLTTVVEVYDPATDTWVSAEALSQARYQAFSGVIDGSVYLFGGYLDGWGTTNSIEVYSP